MKHLSEKKSYLLLESCMFIYSLNTLFAKFASQYNFFSKEFITFYCVGMIFLVVYALLWQQVLKRMPLNTAFANKSITVVWGVVFGVLIFGEELSMKMILACLVIVIGICLVAGDD